jgi:hypothetical protein
MYNKKESECYTVFEAVPPDTTPEIANFPSTIGVTGQTIRDLEIRVCQNTKREAFFNNDIDNVHSLSQVKNFLFGPIYGIDGDVVGVVQLLNKIDSEITNHDIVIKFEFFYLLLGTF